MTIGKSVSRASTSNVEIEQYVSRKPEETIESRKRTSVEPLSSEATEPSASTAYALTEELKLLMSLSGEISEVTYNSSEN